MRKISALLLLLASAPCWATTYYLTTTGSDANNCTNNTTQACLTMNRGIAVAAAGDTVSMAAGTYVGSQTINQTKSTPGVAVVCTSATIGACTISGELSTSGAWYSLQDITVNVGNTCHDCGWGNDASNVTFTNFNMWGSFAGAFWTAPGTGGTSTNVSWIGGQLLDPTQTSGMRNCANHDRQGIWIGTFNSGTITNIVIRGVTFSPLFVNASVLCNSPPDPLHLERIRVDGNISNALFERNNFLDGGNENSGTIFQSSFLGGPPSNIIWRNNHIGGGGTAAWQDNGSCSVTFQYNTWTNIFLPTGCTGTGMVFTGNLMALPSYAGCLGTHTKNVLQAAQTWSCGTDRVVIGPDFSTSALGISPTDSVTLTAGSPGIDSGETTCASSASSIDIKGNTRPVGAACDAGAFEFGSSGGGGDTTPPTASVTAPSNGATITGASVPLTASCTDNSGTCNFQFRVDNVSVGSVIAAAPYTYTLDSTALSNGTHNISCIASDPSLNTTTCTNVAVTVSNAGGGTRTAPTKGTPFGNRTSTAATTLTIASTSFSSGQTVGCWITVDDNTSNNSTAVTGVTIGGSPTYSIPWTLGLRYPWSSTGTLDFEFWYARLSSAVSSQTITVSLNASDRASAVCQPITGTDSTTPVGAVTGAIATGVTVSNTAKDNSLYALGLGCGDNTSRTVTAGTGYTLSGVEQGFSTTNGWVHTAVEVKDSAVTPAANTAGSFTTACSNAITIGVEFVGALTSVSAPSTPTGLAATAGNAQIIWTWNSAATAASYTLSVGASGGPYTNVFTGATLTYTQTGLTNGTQRCAKILATNAGGDSALSSQVCATPTDPTPSPTAPTNLQASPGNASVVLTWTASGNSPTGYKVYRGTTSGGETLLATIGNVVTYTDSTPSNATNYYYYVKGTNATGDSAASNEVSATPTNCLIGNDLVPTSSSSFSSQAAYFSVVWDDILSTSVGNATSGVSSGAINSVADLAAAIRFGPTGFIEALNGASYTALNPVPWLTNTTYSFRLFIDVASHKYNAYVTPPSGAEKIIANNYSFGTSSGSVSALNYMNVSRDLHQVCSYTVTTVYQTVTGSKAGSTVSGGTVK